MTLRSDQCHTYQIVGSKNPAISTKLDQLRVGSQVAVTLTKAPGRGNSWRVTGIESIYSQGETTITAGRQLPKIEG